MAVDFFMALGMTADAETIIESIPRDSIARHNDSIARQNESISKKTVASVSARPKTAQRKPIWIGVAAILVVILIGLAIGAVRIFSSLSSSSNPTETQSPENTQPAATGAATAAVVELPSSDGMVEIPAGSYEVGANPADKFHSAPSQVDITDFWIDKYQVTNSQFQKFMDAAASPAPEVWPADGNHPVRGVGWDQANAYCSWANKRLVTEAEWEAAGRGPGPNPPLYPWGDDATAGGKTFSMPDQDTYAVGSLPFNVSPSGVFDLVGNVWEWVGEPYSSVQEGYKILRGGRFGIPQDLAYRLAVAPDDTRYIKLAGFRCAADKVK
jgi:formylglycine-generating enzyme required for sulfatase activity